MVVELGEDHHTEDAVELHLAVDQQQQQEDELWDGHHICAVTELHRTDTFRPHLQIIGRNYELTLINEKLNRKAWKAWSPSLQEKSI